MDQQSSGYSALRYFLLLFLPTVAIIFTLLYLSFRYEEDLSKSNAYTSEKFLLSTLSHELENEIYRSVLPDLLTLSADPRMTAALEDSTIENHKKLGEVMLGLARNKFMYDQIRLIDITGQEIIRVNSFGENAYLVEEKELQNKAGRYYFEDTLRQLPGQVYLSPMDLNVEGGRVEQPLKPMIRIGTPLFDQSGNKKGVLIFNYLAQELLSIIDDHNQSDSKLMLINSDGYWLKGLRSDQEWGFMLTGREDSTFAKRFPQVWEGVRDNMAFQHLLEEGLVSSFEVDPIRESALVKGQSAPKWKLVSFLPTESLMALPTRNFPNRLLIGGFILVLAFAASVALSRSIAKHNRVNESLLKANKSQEQLITELKQAQGQLVQSEKMAGIGQLAAGVAHEINNPVGFVGSNVNSLNHYAEELLEIIDDLDSQISSADNLDIARERIIKIKDSHELNYLREDIADLSEETKDGISRIKHIVADLKGFARASDESWDLVDIHGEIDRTLNLVNNEVKYHCTVHKEYGEIPMVECIVSEINQVVMNLLVNAAQAIEERGNITIRSGAIEDSVWIEVEDDGKGIPESKIDHIFEPFFTTKPIGKGTGLGLSISYGIIEKHSGRIEVFSEMGKGSRFRITLPVTQSEKHQTVSEELVEAH